MKHVKDLFWILLMNGIYSLNTSDKTDVNDTAPMSLLSNFQTFQTLCDAAATNVTTIRTLNRTSSANDNNLCRVNSSETPGKSN